MIHLRKKLYSLRRSTALLLVLLLAPITMSAAWAASNWGDAPANLTTSEYLNLQFKLAMSRPESEALNSFSLVGFYPSSNPQDALVVVIQTWRDERVRPEDLRREIRKVGDALADQFNAMAGHPDISKRWKIVNPKASFVVKHVRYSDIRETLAVTLRGETVFDNDLISKAKEEVTVRGGVWGW